MLMTQELYHKIWSTLHNEGHVNLADDLKASYHTKPPTRRVRLKLDYDLRYD